MQFLKDILTARNGVDYSLTKLGFIGAESVMLWKFITTESADYLGFATGIAALLAAMAAKYHVENKE